MPEERRVDKGPKARGPGERWRARRDIVIFGVLLCIGFTAYLVDRDNTADHNRVAIIDGITANCSTNAKQDERIDQLITLFVTLAQQNLDDPPPGTTPEQIASSKQFLKDFGKPVPPVDCEQQKQKVENAIE